MRSNENGSGSERDNRLAGRSERRLKGMSDNSGRGQVPLRHDSLRPGCSVPPPKPAGSPPHDRTRHSVALPEDNRALESDTNGPRGAAEQGHLAPGTPRPIVELGKPQLLLLSRRRLAIFRRGAHRKRRSGLQAITTWPTANQRRTCRWTTIDCVATPRARLQILERRSTQLGGLPAAQLTVIRRQEGGESEERILIGFRQVEGGDDLERCGKSPRLREAARILDNARTVIVSVIAGGRKGSKKRVTA